MPNIFADAGSVIFNDDNFGMDANYTPLSGSPATVRVIFRESREYIDPQGMTTRYLSTMAFLKSEVVPARNDQVSLNGIDYVIGKPVDGADNGIVSEYWVHGLD